MPQFLLCADTETSPDITLTEHGTCFDTVWEDGHVINQTDCDLSRLEFICETLPGGMFPDYAVSDMGCPVVSEKLKYLLQTSGIDNIEYYPATVIERKGEAPKSGYFAANIIGLVDCIDKEKSVLDSYEADGEITAIFGIEELSLLEGINDSVNIYRAYLFRRIIIIQAQFKKIFEDAGIKGLKFIAPERWDGYSGEK